MNWNYYFSQGHSITPYDTSSHVNLHNKVCRLFIYFNYLYITNLYKKTCFNNYIMLLL